MAGNQKDAAVWASALRPSSCFALDSAGDKPIGSQQPTRLLTFERLCDRRDVLRCVATAAAGNVDEPGPRKVAEITGHVRWTQIETGFRKRIGQTGIRIAGDRHIRLL